MALDLRTGTSIWEVNAAPPSPSFRPSKSFRTDVIIVGAGITGAFIAERLTRVGRSVVVIDRHQPQRSSTAASTALLQWEIDAPLLELERTLGFRKAAEIYRSCIRIVRDIARLITDNAIDADFAPRKALFLAGDKLNPRALQEEHRLRKLAGIEGTYLSASDLDRKFRIHRDAALLYGGAAEIDPIKLARGLLNIAISRGARVASPLDVIDYDCSASGVTLGTAEGIEIGGNILILANGYEMPKIVYAPSHSIVSTWALATEEQPIEAIWPERCLLWEASSPYLYLRTTRRNEFIVGGEDEDIVDAKARDDLIPLKTEAILRKLSALIPFAKNQIETAWTGFFGKTSDGLPLIGPVSGQPKCFGAFGYGGNGITFSALAAEIIVLYLSGQNAPLAEALTIDRDSVRASE